MNLNKLHLSKDEKSILEGFLGPYMHLGGMDLLTDPEGQIERLDREKRMPELLIALNEEKKFHHIHILTYIDEQEISFLSDMVKYDKRVQEYLDMFARMRMKANAWEKEYLAYEKIVQDINSKLNEVMKSYINENVVSIEEKMDMPRPLAKLNFFRAIKKLMEEDLSLSQMKLISSGEYLKLI